MKNILFNTWSGAFFNTGGGEVQLLKTKEALEKKGYNIDLYNQWHPQKDFNILHQFSIGFGVDSVVNNYKELGKKIALSTICWTIPPKDHFFYHHIRHLLNVSDILLTNSDAESNRLSQEFEIPIEKFHKTRNSISTEYLTLGDANLFRSLYKIEGDFVLSVANIDTRKNTEMLARACQELGIQLITIGHIRDWAYYNSFKDKYDQHRHLGPISDTEILKSAYRSCRIFALPSICETPGIAALEAASQGAQIVITDQGPTEEYFGAENISLVSPFDFLSIVGGVQIELKQNRSDRLQTLVKNEFIWDKTADDTILAYKKLLS